MTEKNPHLNVGEELERAERAFGAASLLLTLDREPRSHEAALRLFSLHFVKTGLFCVDSSHLFSRLMKYREEADYNPSYSFGREDFTGLKDEARALATRICDWLTQKGYQTGPARSGE